MVGDFGLLIRVLSLFAKAPVIDSKQSAAERERRDGTSYPSCKILNKITTAQNKVEMTMYVSVQTCSI
jgi:hypothetical protein